MTVILESFAAALVVKSLYLQQKPDLLIWTATLMILVSLRSYNSKK